MPEYVYTCANDHFESILHSMKDCDIERRCSVCGEVMHRVPQAMRFYFNPGRMLLDKLNDAFIDQKARNDKWRQRKKLGKIIS